MADKATTLNVLLAGLVDSSGNRLAAGTINFYEPGTTTAKNVYQDRDKAVSAGSLITLDSTGGLLYGTPVFLDGLYKIVIKNSAGSTILTLDNFSTGTDDQDVIEDISSTVANMRTTTDPYPAGVESLATSLTGELQRIRYLLKQQHVAAQWYIFPDLVSKTAAYTATQSDRVILCDATSAAFTVTLPAASGLADKIFMIKKTDSSTNAVTVDGNASETIDGATTKVLYAQNDFVIIVSNGSNWFIVSGSTGQLANNISIRDKTRGLIIKNNATNPDYQMDIDADEIILHDTNRIPYTATSVNLTVDITVSGANGLDTGAEAGSTWYYLWVIYNGTTVAGLLSTSSTAPTMPSGYTYKALTGAIRNNTFSDLGTLYQRGNKVRCKSGSIASLTATVGTVLDISSLIPATAKFLWASWVNATIQTRNEIHPATFTEGSNNAFACFSIVIATVYEQFGCPIETTQTIYYAISAGSATLAVQGWEY